MAQCVFCGGEAAFGKTVKFDDFSFRACAGCYDIYSQSSRCLIMRAVKKAGIYKYMGDVSSWLEREEEERAQERKEKAAKLKEDIESYEVWRNGRECGVCPKCGGAMLALDPVDLLHYTGSLLLTMNISGWNASSIYMDMAACEDCGYTEFYSKYLTQRHEAYLKNKEQLEELLQEEKEQ